MERTNLRNVDRDIFPKTLKLVGSPSEKNFAVPWFESSLSASSMFVKVPGFEYEVTITKKRTEQGGCAREFVEYEEIPEEVTDEPTGEDRVFALKSEHEDRGELLNEIGIPTPDLSIMAYKLDGACTITVDDLPSVQAKSFPVLSSKEYKKRKHHKVQMTVLAD